MRLANGWLVSGLTLLIATAASAQSIAIPKPTKPVASVAMAPPPPIRAIPRTPTLLPAPASTVASGSAIYTYDSLGRLIQDAYPSNTASYSYDAAGNRTVSQTQ